MYQLLITTYHKTGNAMSVITVSFENKDIADENFDRLNKETLVFIIRKVEKLY